MFYIQKRKNIYSVYVSNNSSNHEKQVFLLMVPNIEGLKLSPKDDSNNDGIILQPKKLSESLRGISTKNHGDFYCRNCFHSFTTKNELQSHKRVCENKDFCNLIMSSEDARILEFNQYQKSGKAPFIIYADLECIIE